ncbi:hypothetical protein [Streptomyces sp. NPDC003877]
MRQRLIVDRRLRFGTSGPGSRTALLRTEEGRRLGEVVVREKWQRLPERHAAPVVD